MSPGKHKLYSLSWSLYARRVIIYLKEKGILSDFDIIDLPITHKAVGTVPGKSAGTIPMPEICDGRHIFESIAILEHLEDTYSQAPNMRGATPEATARVRDLMTISQEACVALGEYCRHGSKLFENRVKQSPETARASLDCAHQLLSQLEEMADEEGPFLADITSQPTIADCMTLSTLQFGNNVYRVDLLEKHPRLKKFLDTFEERESAEAPTSLEFFSRVGSIFSVR